MHPSPALTFLKLDAAVPREREHVPRRIELQRDHPNLDGQPGSIRANHQRQRPEPGELEDACLLRGDCVADEQTFVTLENRAFPNELAVRGRRERGGLARVLPDGLGRRGGGGDARLIPGGPAFVVKGGEGADVLLVEVELVTVAVVMGGAVRDVGGGEEVLVMGGGGGADALAGGGFVGTIEALCNRNLGTTSDRELG